MEYQMLSHMVELQPLRQVILCFTMVFTKVELYKESLNASANSDNDVAVSDFLMI